MPNEPTTPAAPHLSEADDYLTTREAYTLLKVSRATFNRVYRKPLVQDSRTRWTPTGLPRYARSSILALYQTRPEMTPREGSAARPAPPLAPAPTVTGRAPNARPKRTNGRQKPSANQIPMPL